jgi:L-threonylcarbamoyladenylate synthase
VPVHLTVDAAQPAFSIIEEAAERLRAGAIVAYPTDTFYGLAVDPRSDEAVQKLFQVKGRAASTAIPLIAGSLAQAMEAGTFSPAARRLAEAFWPGPLTIVVPARAGFSPLLSGSGTLGVRVPAHAVARALAVSFTAPITSTSANRSGDSPVRSAREVIASLGDELDLVLDGGEAPGGPPSTLVELVDERPVLHRSGAIPWSRVLESLE